MKTASLIELGKDIVCGMFRMAGHLLRVLVLDRGYVVFPNGNGPSSYQGLPFWISKRPGS